MKTLSIKKSALYSLIALGIFAVAGVGVGTVFADEGNRGMRQDGERGDRMRLVSEEMRETFRANFENLSEEEREALKEERKAEREAHRAEFEAFIGLTHEEVRELRQNGETIGDALIAQGKTEADAETFLTDSLNEKVDSIVERHDLDASQEQTLRDRVIEMVQDILNRWFDN
jgi:hypothetical protein